MRVHRLKNESGFSFLGMIVLVIFLALAGGIVMVSSTSTFDNQGLTETVRKMDELVAALGRYRADAIGSARPPGLNYLITDVATAGCTQNIAISSMQGWCGPYIQVIFQNDVTDYAVDGWGIPFEYSSAGVVTSWGPNRIDDAGAGDDLIRTF